MICGEMVVLRKMCAVIHVCTYIVITAGSRIYLETIDLGLCTAVFSLKLANTDYPQYVD